jgi:acyl-CoA synthetase (AMP-forming)/AMP-acid ligase II
VHSDGYVKIKDRSKDIIISGGENISSLEVEDVLYRHPAVIAAAVVAKPDEKWGEVPAAFIELKDGVQTTEAEIIEHCRAHLARFKVPKQVVLVNCPRRRPARSRNTSCVSTPTQRSPSSNCLPSFPRTPRALLSGRRRESMF